ncbi:MAG: hypothetical protein GYA69_04465 [Candidatus Moranbacteria bacterium]|nr:hypothetical protein [Candidatus Moranbacteria bacterium]
MREPPSRDEIIGMVAKQVYGGPILNNAHRGNVVEMMVLSALGPEWHLVGLGWHLWDLQRGNGASRVRIQVKQLAALQLWGPTVTPLISFGWKKKAPSYFFRDHPDEAIESEGWFCDLFVCGIHLETDRKRVDQADPAQWQFLVIPTSNLKPRLNSMALSKALVRWKPVTWSQLPETVEQALSENSIGAK